MSTKKELTLTSVKIQSDMFEEFKINSIKNKFSFQKLADRAVFLYNTDTEFRKMIHRVNIIDSTEG